MWSLLGLLWIHRRYEHKNIIHLFKFWFHSVYFKMQQISAPSHSFFSFFFPFFCNDEQYLLFKWPTQSFWVMPWWITAMKEPGKHRRNRESHTLQKAKISMATLLKHSCLKMDLPSLLYFAAPEITFISDWCKVSKCLHFPQNEGHPGLFHSGCVTHPE